MDFVETASFLHEAEDDHAALDRLAVLEHLYEGGDFLFSAGRGLHAQCAKREREAVLRRERFVHRERLRLTASSAPTATSPLFHVSAWNASFCSASYGIS